MNVLAQFCSNLNLSCEGGPLIVDRCLRYTLAGSKGRAIAHTESRLLEPGMYLTGCTYNFSACTVLFG